MCCHHHCSNNQNCGYQCSQNNCSRNNAPCKSSCGSYHHAHDFEHFHDEHHEILEMLHKIYGLLKHVTHESYREECNFEADEHPDEHTVILEKLQKIHEAIKENK